MKKLIAFLFGLFICLSVHSQTNFPPFRFLHELRVINQTQTNFYNPRETVVEFAPTISSQNISSSKDGYSIGYSIEIEHWTSQFMGTGFEIGSYNYKLNIIDHFAVMEDFRYVPFQSNPFWRRLAIGWKTGAETFFTDGTKDLEFGGEIYWHFSENIRFEADMVQHERTDSTKNGQTARCAIQWLF